MKLRSRTAALIATAATVLALGAAGVAAAADDGSAAASSLTLSLIPVDNPTGTAKSVTLECDPDGGTHPDPKAACAALTSVGGDFTRFATVPTNCSNVYAPVTAVEDGIWNGVKVTYHEVFQNDCVAAAETQDVFKF